MPLNAKDSTETKNGSNYTERSIGNNSAAEASTTVETKDFWNTTAFVIAVPATIAFGWIVFALYSCYSEKNIRCL